MNQTPEHEPTQPGIYRVPDFDFAAFMSGFRDSMTKLEEEAKPVRDLISATSIRVESEGGEVALTVTIGGDLAGIELLPAAEDTEPAELASAIIATHERAREAARDQAPEVLAKFLDLQHKTLARAQELLKQAQVRRNGTGDGTGA